MPKRIQRTKGWRKPPGSGCVFIGRPTKFGNPFDWKHNGRKRAKQNFRIWLSERGIGWFPSLAERREYLLDHLDELRGKDLVCWCPLSEPCHGDVLLELANMEVKDD